jgi:hypothetical protein
MRLVLEALVARVRRFEISRPHRAINQYLRGLGSLEMTVWPDRARSDCG